MRFPYFIGTATTLWFLRRERSPKMYVLHSFAQSSKSDCRQIERFSFSINEPHPEERSMPRLFRGLRSERRWILAPEGQAARVPKSR